MILTTATLNETGHSGKSSQSLNSKHRMSMNEPAESLSRKIALTQGKFAIVDAVDYELLNQWKWYFCNGYAARRAKKGERIKTALVKMHRIIARTPQGRETDHINGNKLDNRRSNLRICTHSQNGCNRSASKSSLLGFKGVSASKQTRRFKARITIRGKRIHIGYFDTPELASLAYRAASMNHHGAFART